MLLSEADEGGETMRNLKIVKNAYSIMTVCLILVGAILLFWPQMGLDMICKIYGIFLVIYGIAKLSGYFARDLFQLAFQFDLALGIASLIFGFVMIFRTGYAIEFLAGLIGVFMLIDAVFKIQTAIEANRFGIERWWMILVIALIVAVIGALLLIRPFRATGVITRLIGLNLCLDGILNLYVVQSTVKTIRRDHDWDI